MNRLFSLLAGVALACLSTFAWAANEVKLLKVQSIVTRYAGPFQSPYFEVLVANIGYTKQVDVRLKNWDGNWIDVPLSYDRPADGGREVWTGNYTPGMGHEWDLEFALRYRVNGQTYWDNNGGANYRIARDSGTILIGRNVYNAYYDPVSHGSTYYGTATVKNLAFTKQVNVVYTTDGWRTTRTAPAVFYPYYWSSAYSSAPNPNAYGFEEWSFNFPVPVGSQLQYAISYTVAGQTYWDNNFGRNYTVSIIP